MIWTTLLCLRAQLQTTPAPTAFRITCSDCSDASVIDASGAEANGAGAANCLSLVFDEVGEHKAALSIIAREPFAVEFSPGHRLTDTERRELEIYLPYAILPWFSHRQNRTFAISHFAQTLDGRIASASGDSKWIGNQENLTHAHKMRALCDAILVGSSTLRADQPRLNVRHVSGVNPLRVILGENFAEDDITHDNNGPVLVINQRQSTATQHPQMEQLTLTASNGKINCHDILAELYRRQIASIYIEGGAATTSHFLASLSLDQVQIHVSPRILGSGLTGFAFDGVETMEQAVDFNNPRFLSIGDQVMFVGEVACREHLRSGQQADQQANQQARQDSKQAITSRADESAIT